MRSHDWWSLRALPFWRSVILAWPARPPWPRWAMIPYLALAMYQSLPLAGIIMWVPGSLLLLFPLIRLAIQLSSGRVVMEGYHA